MSSTSVEAPRILNTYDAHQSDTSLLIKVAKVAVLSMGAGLAAGTAFAEPTQHQERTEVAYCSVNNNLLFTNLKCTKDGVFSSQANTLVHHFIADNFAVTNVYATKGIEKYLEKKQEVIDLINKAANKISVIFTELQGLGLKWVQDPEGKELYLIVKTSLPVEEAQQRFSRLLKYWITLPYYQRDMLQIGLDVL